MRPPRTAMGIRMLGGAWAGLFVCTLVAAVSAELGDWWWTLAFATLAVFFAIVVTSGHMQRRWARADRDARHAIEAYRRRNGEG